MTKLCPSCQSKLKVTDHTYEVFCPVCQKTVKPVDDITIINTTNYIDLRFGPCVPDNEIWFMDQGVRVGRIRNIGSPEDIDDN